MRHIYPAVFTCAYRLGSPGILVCTLPATHIVTDENGGYVDLEESLFCEGHAIYMVNKP